MANKGSPYERQVAKDLSLWWSHGERDDLCWRTANSGGRATVRGRKGQKTTGHAGDLGATDAAMLPFFRLVTVELKRGYNGTANLHNLFDPPTRAAKSEKAQTYPAFLKQTEDAAARAGTPHWILVHRPDRKNAVFFADLDLVEKLEQHAGVRMSLPHATFRLSHADDCVFGPLAGFFRCVFPEDVRLLYQIEKGK